MEKERKQRLMFAGLILVALITCGVIGYTNRSDAGLSGLSKTQTALPAALPVSVTQYCLGTASLCVISFGLDNAGNMLIVLKHTGAVKEIYARVKQPGTMHLLSCQNIEFSPETYYCLGDAVLQGSDITLEVYTKDGNILLASGEISVQFGATPLANATKKPLVTVFPTIVTLHTATPPMITVYPNRTAYPGP